MIAAHEPTMMHTRERGPVIVLWNRTEDR